MYTPYLLILTMFAGAGEIVDPRPHASLDSCRSELEIMKAAVDREWSVHGILRTRGECRITASDERLSEIRLAGT